MLSAKRWEILPIKMRDEMPGNNDLGNNEAVNGSIRDGPFIKIFRGKFYSHFLLRQ